MFKEKLGKIQKNKVLFYLVNNPFIIFSLCVLLLASSLRVHTWPTYSNIFSTSLPQTLIYCIHWAWSENCEEKRTAFIHISLFDSLNYECSVAQLCLTLCDPMDCSLPDSSVHSILQARILEWVAIPISIYHLWKELNFLYFIYLEWFVFLVGP